MAKLHFPAPFKHRHPPVENVAEAFEEGLSPGERAADWVATTVGSWPFIIGQSALLACWVVLNVVAVVRHWDPYPFILMNLVLSLQAAYTAPIIMMSQNRQADRDRLEAHNDYVVNQKAEVEVRAILDHLVAQDRALTLIYQALTGATSGQVEGSGEPSGD